MTLKKSLPRLNKNFEKLNGRDDPTLDIFDPFTNFPQATMVVSKINTKVPKVGLIIPTLSFEADVILFFEVETDIDVTFLKME